MIPIYEPEFGALEKKFVNECIDTGWISSQGKFVKLFEEEMASFHRLDNAIVTSSCTTALHLALVGMGIGPGDDVICPDLTFIAPANMIALTGASLNLVDINPLTLTLDPQQVEDKIKPNTRAIMVVHQFGHAADMDAILDIARRYNLKVIEDNAESIGGKYKGKILGTFGDAAVYSFFGNKIITSGEGGAVISTDSTLCQRLSMLRDHGMNPEKKYEHLDLGFNYRMTNLQAAVGYAQLLEIKPILEKRHAQWMCYEKYLGDIEEIQTRQFAEWCSPVHWLMTVSLESHELRDGLIDFMKNRGIECRPMINPVHEARHFAADYNADDFPQSCWVSRTSLHLPSGNNITEDQIMLIADTMKDFF